MSGVTSIGTAWSENDLRQPLEEFARLYADRPITDNSGGMSAPHLFYTWFALKALRPQVVVESGVWLGQGTWFIEQACPDAEIICIEPAMQRIKYRSKRARYETRDFSSLDWSAIPKDKAVLFFDDHQSAYARIKDGYWFGFKHFLFEDNYPAAQGDCYSLKKVFMRQGFSPRMGARDELRKRFGSKLQQAFGVSIGDDKSVEPNTYDARLLEEHLETYFEFPPIFKMDDTRWNEPWSTEEYPTPSPLFENCAGVVQTAEHLAIHYEQAKSYTWFCYARLR